MLLLMISKIITTKIITDNITTKEVTLCDSIILYDSIYDHVKLYIY